jgi:hypothetical protein
VVRVRREPSDFLRARLVALYLLSLAAVYGSMLAWRPDRAMSSLSLGWPPFVLGTAAFGGAAIHERLAGLADRHLRARIRSVAAIVYGAALFLISLGLLVGHRNAAEGGVEMLQALQPAFLLLAGFGRGHLGTLINAFVLTCASILAGGAGAAVSATLHSGLLVFFLAADHAARKLTEYPVDVLPKAAPFLLRGAALSLAVAGGIAAWFLFFPASAYAPLRRSGAVGAFPADQLAGLLGNLLFIAVVSAVAFYLFLRLGGGGRNEETEAPLVAFVPALRRSQKAGGTTCVEAVPSMKEWRTRIVTLYVRTTEQLAKGGHRRRPWQTPREFARTLAPAGPAGELAELFSRARYGREEMTESDFETASRTCRAILEQQRRGKH